MSLWLLLKSHLLSHPLSICVSAGLVSLVSTRHCPRNLQKLSLILVWREMRHDVLELPIVILLGAGATMSMMRAMLQWSGQTLKKELLLMSCPECLSILQLQLLPMRSSTHLRQERLLRACHGKGRNLCPRRKLSLTDMFMEVEPHGRLVMCQWHRLV